MDSLVIYYAKKDRRWVAHSLKTDQIGTGRDPMSAIVDALKAIRQVIALAQSDPTINPWRPAPPRVQQLAKRSLAIPDTVGEMALKMANGLWPEKIRVELDPPVSRPLKADLLAVGY